MLDNIYSITDVYCNASLTMDHLLISTSTSHSLTTLTVITNILIFIDGNMGEKRKKEVKGLKIF